MTKEEKAKYMVNWRASHKVDRRAYRRKWYKKNKKLAKNSQRKWISENKEKWRTIKTNQFLKRHYGISLIEYNDLLKQQNMCCAICGDSALKYKRKLHVDHNHNTGKTRGLLCVNCNTGIGKFRESLTMLEKAKQYLLTHENKISLSS